MKGYLKKFLISLFACVIIFGFVSESFAIVTLKVHFRRYQVGGTESVDNIPYANLMAGVINVTFCMVTTDAGIFIPYLFDKTSSASEDAPLYDIITPDDQSGNGRWKKVTGLALGRTATQASIFRSSDATDSDINAQVDIDVTDPDSGQEDIDYYIRTQIAGVLTDVVQIDADGNIELALDADLASGKTYKINGTQIIITDLGAFTKANLESVTSDVADYAEADGDAYTGTHNFETADDIAIPSLSNPVTDTAGQIAIDESDAGQDPVWGEVYDDGVGNASRIIASDITCEDFTILEPDTAQAASDDIKLKKFVAEAFPFGVTVIAIHVATDGTNISDTFLFEKWDDPDGTSQVTVESITLAAADSGEDDGIDSGAITADYYLNLNLDDASDDYEHAICTVCYRINPGD